MSSDENDPAPIIPGAPFLFFFRPRKPFPLPFFDAADSMPDDELVMPGPVRATMSSSGGDNSFLALLALLLLRLNILCGGSRSCSNQCNDLQLQ